jgi:hypothetical protein
VRVVIPTTRKQVKRNLTGKVTAFTGAGVPQSSKEMGRGNQNSGSGAGDESNMKKGGDALSHAAQTIDH